MPRMKTARTKAIEAQFGLPKAVGGAKLEFPRLSCEVKVRDSIGHGASGRLTHLKGVVTRRSCK